MRLIDWDSCKIEDDKLICQLVKKFGQQSSKTILARGSGQVIEDDDEFTVEAAPYASADVGISIPLGPAPGAPSIDFSVGPDLPFTIFPIPKKIIQRMSQPWLPVPIKLGSEDNYQPWLYQPKGYPTKDEILDAVLEVE